MQFLRSLCFVLTVCLAVSGWAQHGAVTAPQNLSALVSNAGTIVHGHVFFARVEPHPQFQHLPTVVVTMKVDEVMKGQAQKTFTFRQFLWDIRDRLNAGGYRKGEELVLMLTTPSEYGLSAPVGMEQGRFRISQLSGRLVAENGRGNIGLLAGVQRDAAMRGVSLSERSVRALTLQAGPLPLNDMKQLVADLARSNR